MLETHRSSGADVTIGAVPVTSEAASAFGIMRLNETGRVVGFLEKPKTPEELSLVRTDPAWIEARGIPSKGREALASMGIYIFNRDTLVEVLTKTNYQDFGKEVFPASIRSRHVQVHMFDGYWEDIGTIKAFYEANLELAGESPSFQLTSAQAPIYSRPRFLPPARINGARIEKSLIADGCSIGAGSVIENSVIGLRIQIGKNVTIRNSVLMGADYFERPEDAATAKALKQPLLGIGDGTVIEGAIIDKNCRIGQNVVIRNTRGVDNSPETEHSVICDGIVVIPKGTLLPDRWTQP
jgi:glucose-1-phosphate adenylyltransferase